MAICAKSPWEPAIRREHAFSRSAPGGVDVLFVEAPRDVRRAGEDGVRWLRRLASSQAETGDVPVLPRSAPAPGHRGRAAASLDSALLRWQLQAVHRRTRLDAVVVQQPWQWAAVADLPVRRVFDAADNWALMIPEREEWIHACYRRIAAEADAVVIASPALAGLFPGAETVLVPNGVDPAATAGAPVPAPGRGRMAYLGTLSERFDAGFVAELLERLPDWRLDLYGHCQYAHGGDGPGPELLELLSLGPERVEWHGPIPRHEVPGALDDADVLLIPNRRERSQGQSSMKMLDYAARGRPVVSTTWDQGLEGRMAPGTALVATAGEAADAVRAATAEPAALAAERVAWARSQSWSARWPDWAAAVFGKRPAAIAARPTRHAQPTRERLTPEVPA